MNLNNRTDAQSDVSDTAIDDSLPVASRQWKWRPKFQWFAAEYLIVVLGVLTAIALDRWNDDLKDRGHERQYLLELLEDLEADQTELELNRERAMARAMEIREVVEAVGTADHLFDHTVRVAWPSNEARERCQRRPLACISTLRVFDGSRSVYQELTQSGQLRVIRDRALVSALARYYALVDERIEGQLNVQRVIHERLGDAMHDQGISWWSVEPGLFERTVSAARQSSQLHARLQESYVASHHQVYDIDENHRPMLEELLRLVRKNVGIRETEDQI
ncbi:MAG: hypothetical protein AAGA95_07185 [Pseudomonadota bacterium]